MRGLVIALPASLLVWAAALVPVINMLSPD
jgi:hypothetical protein